MACCLLQQAITWTDVDLLAAGSCIIDLKAIAMEIFMKIIITTHLKLQIQIQSYISRVPMS